jgi:hypothetical protein
LVNAGDARVRSVFPGGHMQPSVCAHDYAGLWRAFNRQSPDATSRQRREPAVSRSLSHFSPARGRARRDCLKASFSEGRVTRVPDFLSHDREIVDSCNSSLWSFETV